MRQIPRLSYAIIALAAVAAGPAQLIAGPDIPDAMVAIGATVVNDKGVEIGLAYFILDCNEGDCGLSITTFSTTRRILSGANLASCSPVQGIATTASRSLSASAKGRLIRASADFTQDGCDGPTTLRLDFELAPVSSGRHVTLNAFSGLLVRKSDGSVQAHILPLRSDNRQSVPLPTLPE